MKKLKNILRYNITFYILLFLSALYSFYYIYFDFNNYDMLNKKSISGILTSYTIDGDKLSLVIKEKEKYIINYYFKSKEEKDNFNYSYGDELKINGIVEKPNNNTNFMLFNYRKYLLSKKIKYVVNADKIILKRKNTNILYNIKKNIIKRINRCTKTKKYIKSFIVADKREISNSIISSYQFLGVSHLFAVSGMHVSFISLLLLKILKMFKEKTRYLFVVLFLLFYMFLTNFSISMLRATFQFILFWINKSFNLKIKNANIIILLISFFIIYNPYYIYDIGFCFSFSISFSLILFQDKFKNKGILKTSFLISLTSFLVSLPILINNFNTINFLSIIYNLFYVPFVSYIVFPFGIVTMLFPNLDNIYNCIIVFFENITLLLSNIKFLSFNVANVPFIFIIVYYIFIYFLYLKTSVKKCICAFLIIIIFIVYKSYVITPTITFFDVGQGDSSLIRIKNMNILIDTGGKVTYRKEKWRKRKKEYSISNDTIIPYLKKSGVKKIDYMILTHGDFDHMGESINLVKNFKIDKVIFNNGEYNELELELIKVLQTKNIYYYKNVKELSLNNNKLYFLNTKVYDNENDNSNVIYTNINNSKFLFMGDAGIDREKDILDKYTLKDIDFLKVGHHGSNTSSGKEFINNINPKYSLISVGKNNRYGHPKDEVLDILYNSKIYRTDLDGSINIKLNNNGYKIRTCIQ